MDTNTSEKTAATPEKAPVTLLGLGAMGTALARAWLAAGHPLTVWNRTPARAEALAGGGARIAATAAEAVAASRLVIVCLLDDASVDTALAAPTGTSYVGEEPGHAALHDVALLSSMTSMFAGITQAFALMRTAKGFAPTEFAPTLLEWLGAMGGTADQMAAQLESGDYTKGVASNLAMMTAGNATLLRTTREQGVSAELLTPFMELMAARLAQGGHDEESLTGVVGLLRRGRAMSGGRG